ncbi:fused MFS/spermidine synthase [bacterium]|nr:fused MFS/spermidine synthase [candidate division CSSED10-310 bacterium]
MKNRFQLLILLAFTLSGALGLVYEVIWQRQLALIFGSTLPATTAVLTAFMGGLAAGSWVFGRLARKIRKPLIVYGLLEIGIGLFCQFMPVLFQWINRFHTEIYDRLGGSLLFDAIRFLIAILLLLVPCALMGGTLPLLSRALVQKKQSLGKSLSLLYFFNTIGASIGTLLAGFVLIRQLGMTNATISTATLSIVLGIAICCFSIRIPAIETTADPDSPSTDRKKSFISLLPYLYAFLGAAAMGTQVAWTRALTLVLGSTVYAFALMLTAFLFGLAIGSLASGRFIDQKGSPITVVGVLSFLVCLSIILSIAFLSRLPVVLLLLFPIFHHNFFLWQSCLFMMSILVVFPATFCMGALFPAFGKAYIAELKEVGKQVGDLYVWNTIGGIFGVVICGFLLIPYAGTRLSLIIFSVVFLFASIGLLAAITHDKKTLTNLIVLLLVCLLGYKVIPSWEPALLDSGVYVYAPQLLTGFESNRKILFEREGYHSHVTVSEKNSIKSLRINGKTDGSDGDDLVTQALLAILPLAHLAKPDNVLIIGLGTGVTAGSALNFPGTKVTCVEIDEAVITAARFFDHVSGNPFSQDNFKVIHADARTVLSSNKSKYDAIISEPSNPWITGVSNLFTVDYFKNCLNSLTDDGVMCQWIHSYYMDNETLLIIFRSFQEVFPYCSLWEGSPGDYLILGSRSLNIEANENYNHLFNNQSILADLQRINILSSSAFLDRYVLGPVEFHRMVQSTGRMLNTDDRPYVEFNAPMSLYHDTVLQNRQCIESFRKK